MAYGIRKFCMLNFYSTYKFLSNLLINVTDMNYITHRRFFVLLYQPIHWYPRILTFLSEQRAPISTMFASRAFLNVLWSQHRNVWPTSFNIRDVFELRRYGVAIPFLWQLYEAFVMTWYLALTTSGRTAKAVRPVISGKLRLDPTVSLYRCYSPNSEVHESYYGTLHTNWPNCLHYFLISENV